ncbi:dipeptide ABC transporter ATP-binding protein [Pseudohalocynthiibacter aestuariivivens]|jgi:peptide/nickel transport system ATP-binding protein|uniref:Dipeptide ABC transporter ATP-binding protein n=1 Tax=Pseudohalocynthiibacter aestuariivivens TaxID=1591409 RepID=A0ABV5JJR9_9RHOB|nr:MULTISPECIES: ABC transporter ATP-binding protein [Pseudohalocynthiibacter]MBS9718994.1 ABC transporter ATP-binding protein [Pseudohalocynthiibacter aestuariivivens]MCK0104571.1 ABC transporter ATP-binding protein [Pseudohalocynthiibacter sp. F2068]
MKDPLLDIRNLNVDFRTPRGRVHALRDVSFSVPRGKSVGVVGESGSGKSTVIWAVTQLLARNAVVESGEVLFDGEEVLSWSESQMMDVRGEKISIVFQDPMTSQVPVLNYAQQMTDILYRRRGMSMAEKKKKAIEMMRRVGIPDPESRIIQYPHQFSGGMRQRAGIAMALLMDPMLLIADEPTTALDVTMEAQIIHLMRELQREFEATLMVVSHNLGLIAELCDEVVVMYAGEVIESGDVRDIFYRPAHPYTQALLECDPAREEERARFLPVIPGDIPDLHMPPQGCVFAPRCRYAAEKCHDVEPKPTTLPEAGHNSRCHLLDGTVTVPSGKSKSAETRRADDTTSPRQVDGAALLDLSNLSVRFQVMGAVHARLTGVSTPYVDAVLDASLSLRKGETLGLVGESGSGKTTLGRAILGLVPAKTGQVLFEGQDLLKLPPGAFKALRRDMAMMFQDPVGSLSPRRTVKSLITEPLEIHGRNGKNLDVEAERLCDMVRLPKNFLSRYPHELSGGQARRVGVARALALNPSLVIADEPTAGLDVSVQGEILNLMSELQAEHGLGYLIISHNLPVIRHISDKLAIMYLGRLVERGNCEAIFDKPAHPYTEALVRGVPKPDPDKRRTLLSIEGEVPSVTNRPQGCEFHTRCKYATDLCRTERPDEQMLSDGRILTCHHPLAI